MIMTDKKYPWPASAVTDKEMEVLYNMRQQTKTPISKLIKEAINKTYSRKDK